MDPADRGLRTKRNRMSAYGQPEVELNEVYCEYHTTSRKSLVERHKHLLKQELKLPLKAYKLGKRRWSYNQCEVQFVNPENNDPDQMIGVQDAQLSVEEDQVASLQEDRNGVAYELTLPDRVHGVRVRVKVFVVKDEPVNGPDHTFKWPLLQRSHCKALAAQSAGRRKHPCEGAVLRPIQRYGKLGRRCGQPSQEELAPDRQKDPKYLFLSIDEACTHVKAALFRLLVVAFDENSTRVLGSTVSPPIRVLANNDVPEGAAYIPLYCHMSSEWEVWRTPNVGKPFPQSMSYPYSYVPGSNHSPGIERRDPLQSTESETNNFPNFQGPYSQLGSGSPYLQSTDMMLGSPGMPQMDRRLPVVRPYRGNLHGNGTTANDSMPLELYEINRRYEEMQKRNNLQSGGEPICPTVAHSKLDRILGLSPAHTINLALGGGDVDFMMSPQSSTRFGSQSYDCPVVPVTPTRSHGVMSPHDMVPSLVFPDGSPPTYEESVFFTGLPSSLPPQTPCMLDHLPHTAACSPPQYEAVFPAFQPGSYMAQLPNQPAFSALELNSLAGGPLEASHGEPEHVVHNRDTMDWLYDQEDGPIYVDQEEG
eukprot:jgi/Botrbrau1/13781/Bobra.0056s0033.1